MDRDELHESVRRLLFVSPALSAAFSRGDFRSVFRGRGLDFDSLREYTDADDARLIDWNVTTRFARPYVRTYLEDRSLTLFVLLDVSASMEAGSGAVSKRDVASMAASLLVYAARLRGMPTGGLLFADGVARHFEPRGGKRHALAIVEAALGDPPRAGGSDLAGALDATLRLLKRRSLVVLLSDFRAEGWAGSLRQAARRHDLIAVRVSDPVDASPPSVGSFPVLDAEGAGAGWLALGSRTTRERWAAWDEGRRERVKRACAEAGAPLLDISTLDYPARRLLAFFDRRRVG